MTKMPAHLPLFVAAVPEPQQKRGSRAVAAPIEPSLPSTVLLLGVPILIMSSGAFPLRWPVTRLARARHVLPSSLRGGMPMLSSRCEARAAAWMASTAPSEVISAARGLPPRVRGLATGCRASAHVTKPCREKTERTLGSREIGSHLFGCRRNSRGCDCTSFAASLSKHVLVHG